jgi:AcrR family transcriptional regulator
VWRLEQPGLADAAGVSIGSFYQYFVDKDAAVAAFAQQYARESLTFAWNQVEASNPDDSRVSAWLEAMLTHAIEHEALVRVLFQEVPYTWTLPGVRDAMAGAVSVVERVSGKALAGDDRQHDRAYVILKAAVAVIVDVVADADLGRRRNNIVEELGRMIDAYLRASDGG